MDMRNILVNTRPASFHHERWKDGTPIGNGEMGAMIQGGAREEQMTLTRHDLWDWPIEEELPDVHETLQMARDAMDRGDYAYANGLLANTLHEKGYWGRRGVTTGLSEPFPLGLMKISIGYDATFYHYRRMLDMEHGVACIEYELDGEVLNKPVARCHYKRESFVSKVDGVLVYRVECPEGISQVSVDIDLAPVNDLEMIPNGNQNAKKMRAQLEKTLKCFVQDGMIRYGYEFNGGKHTGAVVRMMADDGEVTAGEKTLKVENTHAVTILVMSFAGETDALAETAQALAELSWTYEELKARQGEAFAADYHSATVHLAQEDAPGYAMSNEALIDQAYDDVMSPELAEKLWNFSRYMFISGTSPDTNPMALLGLWPCDYGLPWPQHVANENVQLIYWHVNTGGLADYAKSLIHYYYKKIPQMQENARKLFGCRGIFLSTYTTPIDSYVAPPVPVIVNWISGAGWLCRHFYDYYLYTRDEELLQAEILPFMRETAAFYEDYLCRDEKGKIKIYPSVSPENSPANFDPGSVFIMGHAMPAVKNATMDFAILKEMLTNLLAVSRSHGIYADKWETWQTILDDIPPYMINKDGAVKEWLAEELDDYYFHRHISHIYPVFPGNEITEESDPKLFKAFERALDLREMGGQCAWSIDHMAAIYSRLGRGEEAWKRLCMLPKSVMLPSLMLVGEDDRTMGMTFEDSPLWVPIQMDVNMGYINAIQEMLFRWQNGKIYLLPACPGAWKNGEVKNFRFPGGRVDMQWNQEKKMLQAVITVEWGERPGVVWPEGMDTELIWQ